MNPPVAGMMAAAAVAGLALGYLVWGMNKAEAPKAPPTPATTHAALEPAGIPAPTVPGAPATAGREGAAGGMQDGVAAGGTPAGESAAGRPEDDGARGHGAPTAGTPGDPGMDPSCTAYVQKLCEGTGEQSAACQQVRAAATLMPGTACEAAMAGIEQTLAKVRSQREACDTLQTRLCAELGEDTPGCRIVRQQTPGMPPEQCAMMLENYGQVLRQLQCMEMEGKPLTAEQRAKMVAGDGPTFGPADAAVTLVEFSDFECPYCSRAAEVLEQIRDRYARFSVRSVFRQFPLGFHQQATPAARAALAAHAQGKFWPYHDLLFANQRELGPEKFQELARQVGLDMEAFLAASGGESLDPAIQADQALGEELCVNGTPTLFLNEQRVPNPTDANAVFAMIDRVLQENGLAVPPPVEPTAPAADPNAPPAPPHP
jgi:protein-disulfide isomerase